MGTMYLDWLRMVRKAATAPWGRGNGRKPEATAPWGRGNGRTPAATAPWERGKGRTPQRPHLGDAGTGGTPLEGDRTLGTREFLFQYMNELAERLRRVRVCCGDWSRVCGPTPTVKLGITGVFLDPPYLDGRTDALYSDRLTVAHEVREWAIAQGDDPRIRIALCGYEGEHDMPGSWDCVEWKARAAMVLRAKTKPARTPQRSGFISVHIA